MKLSRRRAGSVILGSLLSTGCLGFGSGVELGDLELTNFRDEQLTAYVRVELDGETVLGKRYTVDGNPEDTVLPAYSTHQELPDEFGHYVLFVGDSADSMERFDVNEQSSSDGYCVYVRAEFGRDGNIRWLMGSCPAWMESNQSS